jgi:hypothetical protein
MELVLKFGILAVLVLLTMNYKLRILNRVEWYILTVYHEDALVRTSQYSEPTFLYKIIK